MIKCAYANSERATLSSVGVRERDRENGTDAKYVSTHAKSTCFLESEGERELALPFVWRTWGAHVAFEGEKDPSLPQR